MFCRHQLGELASIHAALRAKGVGVAAISVDDARDSRRLATDLGLTFPLLRDDGLRVTRSFGVAMAGEDIAVPAVFLVLPDRTVFWRQVGETIASRPSNHEILEQVDLALARAR